LIHFTTERNILSEHSYNEVTKFHHCSLCPVLWSALAYCSSRTNWLSRPEGNLADRLLEEAKWNGFLLRNSVQKLPHLK